MSNIQDQEGSQQEFTARIKSILKRPDVIGAFLGAIAGYIYYAQIGCLSGTCPLTSNPWFTIAWGGVLGYLIGDMLSKKPGKRTK